MLIKKNKINILKSNLNLLLHRLGSKPDEND